MFVALLQFSPQARFFLQQDDRLGDQLIQGNGILRAQQFFAGAIDTRNLLLLRNLLGAFLEGVFVQQGAFVFESRRLAVHISLVILARYQLILAARKKLDEIAQELSRFGEPPVLVQFQARHVSTEQDPVIHLLQRHTIRLHFFQQCFAKRMKRRKRYRLPALARGLYYAGFHLTGGILALTFTKKAAGEMKARVVKATGERGKAVTLATFHSFCETLLKEVEPNRVALEQVDHWILLRRNLAKLKLDKYRRLAEPGQFLSDFIQFFSRCQDELVSSEDYQRYMDSEAAKLENERASLDEDTFKERAEQVAQQQEIARVYRASEELLCAKNAVALNELIAEAVVLLKKDAGLRGKLQERYKHILVDEFQDTNIAQLELLDLLSAEPRNILVVGDNDQAIYRFRGASFGSFTLFLERFAGVETRADSTPYRVTLTENYRSTPNILRVATPVITQNEVSADFPTKVLQSTKPEGQRIRIAQLATADDEARWVTDQLAPLHAAGRRSNDFAVLYRQHAHRDKVVEELSRRKIPFVISKLSILEHPLVRDVLAYLPLLP